MPSYELFDAEAARWGSRELSLYLYLDLRPVRKMDWIMDAIRLILSRQTTRLDACVTCTGNSPLFTAMRWLSNLQSLRLRLKIEEYKPGRVPVVIDLTDMSYLREVVIEVFDH